MAGAKKRRAWLLALSVVAACIVLVVTFSGKKGRRGAGAASKLAGLENVLLITLDTTRADRLGCYGYAKNTSPNLDGLAARGVCFENAVSPVPLTLPAHCSILTGTYPLYHRVRNNGNYSLHARFVTLAEIFKAHGYQTAAFVSSFTVDSRFALNQGFDTYDDQLTNSEALKQYESERPAAAAFASFRIWLQSRPGGRFFCWLHFYDPHYPYSPPDEYRRQFADRPYDGEIAYMDHYVGEALRLIEASGLSQNTLVVAAGDHGEAFGEHKELGHQIFCYEENLRVPLIFFSPGRFTPGLRVKERVSLIDLMPTILEAFRCEIPAAVQGRSLLASLGGDQPPARDLYFESLFASEVMGCAPLTGIYRRGYKFIDLPRTELFELLGDPGERQNLASSQTPLRLEMKKALLEMVQDCSHGGLESRRALTSREREMLSTLGYLAPSSAARAVAGDWPDPKDMVDAFLEYSTACEQMENGSLEEAARGLRKSLAMNPRFAPAYSKLAAVSKGMGDLPQAQTILRKGISQVPRDNVLKLKLATLLAAGDRGREALAMLGKIDNEEAVANQAEINLLYGQIHEKMKNPRLAGDYYQKALKAEPGNRGIMKKLLALYLSQERLPEALDIYRQFEWQAPDDPRLLRAIAIVAGQAGDFATAEAFFAKVLPLDPDPTLLFDYAVIMSQKKEYGKALELMERFLVQASPRHPQFQLARKLASDYRRLLGRAGE